MRNDLGIDSSNATLESPPVSERRADGDRKGGVEEDENVQTGGEEKEVGNRKRWI